MSTQTLRSPPSLTVIRDLATPSHREADALIRLMGVDCILGGKPILQNVRLTIGRGEFVCVVGPSGSGKTTLLRLLAGLVPATNGQVVYDGKTMAGPRSDLAVVFQDYAKALLPWRTAAGNVALALEAAHVPKREHAGRIEKLLKKLGLGDHANKFPSQMSGGMQQRLQIARCLAQEPKVLLMDEPFGALDAMTRQVLQDELLDIVASTGATVFFVTHDLEEAIYLGDRVVGLLPHPGRVDRIFPVALPKPRDQMSTREQPEFLRLRRELFDFVLGAESAR